MPIKLREDNVFSHVCHFVRHSESHVTNNHDALDLTIQGTNPSPSPLSRLCIGPHHVGTYLQSRPIALCGGTPPPLQGSPGLSPPSPAAGDIWWPRLVTCSNLYQHWRPVQTCSLEVPLQGWLTSQKRIQWPGKGGRET